MSFKVIFEWQEARWKVCVESSKLQEECRNGIHLEDQRGRQSTRSSPESLFAKSFQKTDPDQPPFLLKHEGAK